jgi:DNA-binding transcriptional LysR family regulator
MHASVLRYIDQVARFGSIRRAAETLNVASSAVNRQILKLEAAIGSPLFERVGTGVRPTPAGEYVIRHARDTLADWQRTRTNISALSGNIHGEVRVATIPSAMISIVPQAMEKVSRAHPNLKFRVIDMAPSDHSEEMRAGRPDIAVLFIDKRYRDYEIVTQLGAKVGVVMRPDHPLAKQSQLTLTECSGYPATMLDDPWLLFESTLQNEFSRSGAQLNIVLRTNSMTLMKHSLRNGVGIGFFTPVGFVDEIRTGQLTHVPLSEHDLASTDIGLFVHRRRARSPGVQLLASALAEEFDRASADLRGALVTA